MLERRSKSRDHGLEPDHRAWAKPCRAVPGDVRTRFAASRRAISACTASMSAMSTSLLAPDVVPVKQYAKSEHLWQTQSLAGRAKRWQH